MKTVEFNKLMKESWDHYRGMKKSKRNVSNFGNVYRRHYKDFTFKQKQRFNQQVMDLYVGKTAAKFQPLEMFLDKNRHRIFNVIELGGFEGALASRALETFKNIRTWVNYELVDTEPLVREAPLMATRYIPLKLDKQLWEHKPTKGFNLFVGAHVIEHLNHQDMLKLFWWIMKSKFGFVHLQAPLKEWIVADWSGSRDLHVLQASWTEIDYFMTAAGGWKQFKGDDHRTWKFKKSCCG